MKVRFLCGCTQDVTDPEFHHDDGGMITCPDHGQKRYGWRSVGRDHSYDRLTPYEFERWALFGEIPQRPPDGDGLHTVEDRRDNRDPVAVFEMAQDGRHVGSYQPDPPFSQDHIDYTRRRLDLKDRTGWPVVIARKEIA
jgi:hypothetical protein